MSVKNRRALVVWEDSVSHDPWQSVEDALSHDDIMLVESVGFILKSDRKRVVLCHSIHLDQVCGVMTIPRSAVRSITTL